MLLTTLRVYPVKSLRGYDVDQVDIRPWGLAHDRRWAVLSPDGQEITARQVPRLLLVEARPDAGGGVLLSAAGAPDLLVPVPQDGPMFASEWIGPTVGAGPEAAGWLSRAVGHDVVLVHQADPSADRQVLPEHGGRLGDMVNLADTAPVLLTTTASLRRLDELMAATAASRGETLPAPLSMVRFRPNLVLDGDRAFAEHDWRTIRVGEVVLRYAEGCDRCVMPTYDPQTLVKTHEPTRTLARHRAWGGKVWFGIRLVPTTTGTVRVGDPVEVLS